MEHLAYSKGQGLPPKLISENQSFLSYTSYLALVKSIALFTFSHIRMLFTSGINRHSPGNASLAHALLLLIDDAAGPAILM